MVLIPNKREFLARRMADAGLIRLVERIARRPGLLVLTYHRIGNPEDGDDYAPIYSATVETLERTLQALKKSHEIVSVGDVITLAERGFPLTRPTALVTFDDGYRDNFVAALPVLKALKIPATFFIPTGFFEGPFVPWWDRIAWTVGRSHVPVLRLERPVPIAVDLRALSRSEAVFQVVRAFRDHPVGDESAYFAELEARAKVSADVPSLGRDRFMSWDELRELANSGCDVGSHAHSHRKLIWLSEEDQRDEFSRSKRILEANLGREVPAVAYPYGWPGAYDATAERLARESGYRVAFSSVAGVNRPGTTAPFAIQRLGVGFAESPSLLRARWTLHEAFGRSLV